MIYLDTSDDAMEALRTDESSTDQDSTDEYSADTETLTD